MWVLRSTWQVIFCEKWILCISLLIIYTYSCIIVYLRMSSCAVIHLDNWFTFARSDRTSLSSLPENSGLHPHTQMAPHGSLPLGSWKSNDLSSTPCTKKNYFKPWARAMNHNAVEWSVAHAPVVGKHDWSHSTNNGEAFSIRKFGPAKTTQNTERFELCLRAYIIVGLSETIINSTSDCERSLLFSVSCSPGRPELLPHQAGSETRLS